MVSLQNISAPSIQPLAFTSLVFSYMIDISIFDMVTNKAQIAGIGLIILVSAVQIAEAFCCRVKATHEKAE